MQPTVQINSNNPIFGTYPLNKTEYVQPVSFESIPASIYKALQFCCYGDTYGTGIEMWSREKILEQWSLVTQDVVFGRTPPNDQGLAKGWYSDDTEMSMGLTKALQKEKMLTIDSVLQGFLDVFDAFKTENGGIARGGYGSFGKIALRNDIDRLVALKDDLQIDSYKGGGPGNGSGMRILPVLLQAKEFYQEEAEVLLHNIIVQTIATHNHATAILTNLIYIDVANAIMEGEIEFEQTLEYAIDFIADKRKFNHILPGVGNCFNKLSEISTSLDIPVFGDYFAECKNFTERFAIIDSLECPQDDKGSNLDKFIDQILIQNATPLKGKTGLGGKASFTLFATLYCWKWTLVDFHRGMNTKESYLNILKRGICFGGDVDTLLAHVVPVSFMRLEKMTKGEVDLPDWLVRGCVEAQLIGRRLK